MCRLSIVKRIRKWIKIAFHCSLFSPTDCQSISMDLEASTTQRRDTDANSIPSKKRTCDTKSTQVTMTNYKERLQGKPTTHPVSGFVVPNPNPTNETAIPENDDSLIVYRIKEDGSLCIEKMRREEDESNKPSKMSKSNGPGPGPGPEDVIEGLGEASFSCMNSYQSESIPISCVAVTNDCQSIFMDLEASTTERRDTDANSIPSKKRTWDTKSTQVTMTNYKERLQAKPTTYHVNGFVVPNSNPTSETAIPENDDGLIVYRIMEDGSLWIENLREEGESNEPSKMSTSNGPGLGPGPGLEDVVGSCGEPSFSYMVSYQSEPAPISCVATANGTFNSFTFSLQMTRR